MTIQQTSIERLFLEAIELPLDHRAEFVTSHCGNDSNLEAELNRLLAAHTKNEAKEFFMLDLPIVEANANVELSAEIAERTGDTIGRYKLLEQIGEGGMGVVYMAQQIEDVRRRVALKIIKLGMDTRQVIARFEAERQAMTLFDHPNITKVLDAGATDTGRPYFVMELVKGSNIVGFVNSNQLGLQDRLRLFVDVCQAVQHAHQKGIIHRDLKPSNVLVTLNDGVPTPKVIDFGIAKAIGQNQLTEKTLFTRYSAMVGTPQYMSPEQAELNGLGVDTRSDIYSLGVLLYELVTGSTPLSREELEAVNPLALHETLRDAQIETPSLRLKKTQEKNASTVLTPTNSDSMYSELGELDWVILKALSRDRSARYASANELATDICRYLNREPVLAAPPSRVRKLQAYVRRNARSLAIAALISLALISTSIASIVFAFKASKANNELSSTVKKLSENVEELETAKEEIRATAEQQQFESAISIARARFDLEFQQQSYALVQNEFPDYFIDRQKEDPVQPIAEEDSTQVHAFELSLEYDNSMLLDLPHKNLLRKPLSRLQKFFEQEENFLEQIPFEDVLEQTNDQPAENSLQGKPESALERLALQTQANELVADRKDVFFRELVRQYRKTFGQDDARVAEALLLLSATLINDQPVEAEARLREALVIGSKDSVGAAKQLLAKLQANTERK